MSAQRQEYVSVGETFKRILKSLVVVYFRNERVRRSVSYADVNFDFVFIRRIKIITEIGIVAVVGIVAVYGSSLLAYLERLAADFDVALFVLNKSYRFAAASSRNDVRGIISLAAFIGYVEIYRRVVTVGKS